MTTDARPFLLTDLPEEVREQVYDHVFSADDHEVGGVLVGAVGEDGRAEVHGMIPALEASSARASLTFTHEAWEQVLEIQERDFPDSPTIIGWYHSHPGFGIFLSEHDVFIHQNFFREPHQVAYVVDPQDETEGMFGWRNGRVELFEEGRTPRRRGRRRPGMVIELDPEDATAAATTVGAPAAVDLSQRSVPPTGQRHEIVVDDEAPSRRRRGLLPLAAGLALVLGVGAALVIGGRHDDAQTVASGGAPPIEKFGDPAAVANLNKRTRAQIAAAGSQAVGLSDQDQKRQDRYDQVKQQQDQQNQTSTDSQTQTTDQNQGTQTQIPQTTTQTPQTTTQTPQTTTQTPQTTTTEAPDSGFGSN